MKEELYQVKDVAQILGISVRALQFYVERGLVVPDQPAWGKGTRRKFSKKNLVELLVMRELSACGLDLEDIRFIMRGPRELPGGLDPWDTESEYPEDKKYFLVIYDRKHLRYHQGDEEGNLSLFMAGKPPIWDAPEGGHVSVIAVDITSLREKVKRL